jgi:hypothetical protein
MKKLHPSALLRKSAMIFNCLLVITAASISGAVNLWGLVAALWSVPLSI